MEQMEMELAVKMVNVGLRVLRQRVLMVLAMLLTFVLFAWCVWNPEPFRIVAATIFGFLGFFYTKYEKQGESQ